MKATKTAQDIFADLHRWLEAARSGEALDEVSPDETLRLLQALQAHQLGLETQNEKLRRAQQESRQRQAEISALLDGARAVLRHREFESIARSIFDSCKTLIGASGGYVALLDKDGKENQVLFLDSGGLSCTVDPSLPMPTRGLREQAYHTGKTVYENDFFKSEWADFLPDGHVKLDNVLFAPLVIKGISTGLLGLGNKPGGFTENDARMASAFGELVALSLLNSRTLEALQDSEERFRAIAQTAGEAIITIDSRGTIAFWNKAATTMFGYTRDKAVGKPITLIMPERFRAPHRQGIARVVSTGEPRILGKTVEMVGLGKDGREFPIELSLSTWKSKDETFFSGIIHDISERVRAEEQIQSLARFPGENRNPVLRVAEDGTILYANEASAPLLAAWANQVGQKPPGGRRHVAADAISSNESCTFEVVWKERIYSVDLMPVPGAGYVNLYGRDVTERVRAEEALQERTHDLGERVKELNCLFGISALVEQPGASLADILQGTADLIPAAWQHPEITAARIILEGQEFTTENLSDAVCHQQVADIIVHGRPSGVVEVYYLGEKPECDEGPFLKEERSLINAIAERLGKVTEQMRAEDALQASEERWRSLVENAPNFITIVDQRGVIQFINHPVPGLAIEQVVGTSVYDFVAPEYHDLAREKIEHVFQTGEANFYTSSATGPHGAMAWYANHLGPIKQHGRVIAVTVIASDITERVRVEEALSTLLEISHQVALTVELEPLLDLILHRLDAIVDCDDATIFKLEDETLIALAHRGAVPLKEMLGLCFPLERERLICQLMFDRETVIIPDVQDDGPQAQDLRGVMGERFETVCAGARSWMGAPLTVKDQVVGILALQHSEPGRFTSDQAELVRAFANQAAVAIENTRLYEQAQTLAALEERQRLARDLHDAVSQTLFSASLAADVLPRLWESKPDEAQRCLGELRFLTRGALAEMRTLLLELRPTALMEVALGDLLQQLVEAAASRARVSIELAVDGQYPLPPDVHVTLYRIAQEALSNVVKHAGASQAQVSLRCTAALPDARDGESTDRIELCIQDDGRGFDPAAVPPDRLGLGIMRERAETIGAAIEIQSQTGHGTQLTVVWTSPS